MEQHEKVRENRLRRMAERQGLRLEKSRRRDPLALDYGTYTITDATMENPDRDEGPFTLEVSRLDIDQVETWLTKVPGKDRWRYAESLLRERQRASEGVE